MLLSNQIEHVVSIQTPNGTPLILDVLNARIHANQASCAIQKDSGDDPDVTNGILVYATVSRIPTGVEIDGGEGVGRVTKAGLNQPIGVAAINSVPRNMIKKAVKEAASKQGYDSGLRVVISVPEGKTLAEHTFNPRMGIEGGISILGTSGIVEPMSDAALVDTIRAEIAMLAAQGKKELLFTLGNFSEEFARDGMGLSLDSNVKCSNFIGDAVAAGMEHGIQKILLVGHIGKLVKLSIGLFNTHSNRGDGRLEAILACALKAGGNGSLLHEIMDCVSVDAALALIYEAGLLDPTMNVLKERISYHLSRKVLSDAEIGFVCFTNAGEYRGVLAKSDNADHLMKLWREL
jgi:cobalt-precorrin-5B (C1)-methyltransferase